MKIHFSEQEMTLALDGVCDPLVFDLHYVIQMFNQCDCSDVL